MEVLYDAAACPRPARGSVVTIGAYDGVHVGHRTVIAEVRRRAARNGLDSAVVTFDRHPASVVRPESAPRLLTDLEQKLELLADTGLDRALVVSFDEQRAKEPPEEFVQEVLVGCLGAKVVIVGEDFHFGHQRRGNVALLREMGGPLGFEVEGVSLVDSAGRATGRDDKASSTVIRALLAGGDLPKAERMLGRPYEVRGVVARGEQGHRELGLRTANVSVPGDILLPADGVYAGWYERPDGTVHPTALFLGRRPPFYEQAHVNLLEAHLLDFEGDLYDEAAKVRFVARLPGEGSGERAETVVAEVRRRCEQARALPIDVP